MTTNLRYSPQATNDVGNKRHIGTTIAPMDLASSEPSTLESQQRANLAAATIAYDPLRDYLKGHLKGWLDLRTFFAQRAAIINSPTLMIRYREGEYTSFQSPLKFSIQCLGFYLVVLSIVTMPLQLFLEPVDVANADYIKWFIATLAKIEAITIPIMILVSSYIFAVVIFRKPVTLAMYRADIIHMTYIQARLFWPNTILSLLLHGKYFEVYYFTILDSEKHQALMEDLVELERAIAFFLTLVLLVYLGELSKLFGTTKGRVFWSMWVSNWAGFMVTTCGAFILATVFAFLQA